MVDFNVNGFPPVDWPVPPAATCDGYDIDWFRQAKNPTTGVIYTQFRIRPPGGEWQKIDCTDYPTDHTDGHKNLVLDDMLPYLVAPPVEVVDQVLGRL